MLNKNRLNFIVDKPFAFTKRDTRISKFNLPLWKIELIRSHVFNYKKINPEEIDGWCD